MAASLAGAGFGAEGVSAPCHSAQAKADPSTKDQAIVDIASFALRYDVLLDDSLGQRDTPLLRLEGRADAEVVAQVRRSQDDATILETRLNAPEVQALLRALTDAQDLAQVPGDLALSAQDTRFADGALSTLSFDLGDCHVDLAAHSLALRAARAPKDSPLARFRALELRLLDLVAQSQTR